MWGQYMTEDCKVSQTQHLSPRKVKNIAAAAACCAACGWRTMRCTAARSFNKARPAIPASAEKDDQKKQRQMVLEEVQANKT